MGRLDNVVVSEGEDPRDYIYCKEVYYVGDDIKPGLYKVFSNTYWGYFEEVYLLNKENEGDNVEDIYESAYFSKFSYVDLRNNMKIKLENCYLVPIEKAISFEKDRLYLPPENIYRVGKDIKAGKYEIVPADYKDLDRGAVKNFVREKIGYIGRKKDIQPGYDVFNHLSKVYKYADDELKRDVVELKNGQYLYLIYSRAKFLE